MTNIKEDTTKKVEAVPTYSAKTYAPYVYKPCHVTTEIHPGLFITSMAYALDLTDKYKVDVLIPLDSSSASIWSNGWRGELYYMPIRDRGVLPEDIAVKTANKIIDDLSNGKKVGMYCIGGHGRTGYMTALVLGLLGYKDPIGYIWKNYCLSAIEAMAQAKQIYEITKIETVKDYYKQIGYSDYEYTSKWTNSKNWTGAKSYNTYDDYWKDKNTAKPQAELANADDDDDDDDAYQRDTLYGDAPIVTKKPEREKTCFDCRHFDVTGQLCTLLSASTRSNDEACFDFEDYWDYRQGLTKSQDKK